MKMFLCQMIAIVCILATGFLTVTSFVPEAHADPVDEVHVSVYSVVVCSTHNVPDASSFQWVMTYHYARIEHYDGHEFAVESYESELEIHWSDCGAGPVDTCYFDSWI